MKLKTKLILFFDLVMVVLFLSLNRDNISNIINSQGDTNTNINLIVEEGISNEAIQQVNNCLKDLPINDLMRIKDNKVKICLVSEIEDDENADIETAGLINYSENTIYVVATNKNEVAASLIHELGHYKDSQKEFISNSTEFLSLYSKYKNTYINYEYSFKDLKLTSEEKEYCTSTPQEFFAYIYRDTYLYPDYMKDNFSELYNYIVAMEKED